ncbi:MAG: beta-mannosidase [Sphingomonas sp.]|uniref:beta-mannosidase n=1 Tax=Sphingomonas sp. TaxID=28214 RepID=UPI003F7E37E7
MTERTIPVARTRRAIDSGWSFRQAGTDTWLPAHVPGSNFSDLWRAGRIEDPYRGDAEDRLQWIEQADWDYRCAFEVSADDLLADSVELVFDGLDTFCEVTLNGAPLIATDNMFRTCRIEVRDRLRMGANDLALHFRSPVVAGAARQATDGFFYPAENDKTPSRASVYARKAPYHFGWDWGPKYVTSGVWRPVWLDLACHARIRDAAYRIDALDDARAVLTFDVEVEALAGGEAWIEILCEEPGVAPVRISIALDPDAGVATHRAQVTVDAPRRWWPNGLGEPFLYDFRILLADAAGPIDAAALRVGLRTVRVRHEPDEIGQCFAIEVNGRPVFMKGANYIPPDSLLERMTPDRYRQLFRDTVDANMNMLRVWGGGIYENDLFYDLADEHGILIWQDFMFSCTLYPFDPAFLANVAEEARQNIRRLRNHPSLALWCGNNEVTLGIAEWEWPEKFAYSPDHYRALVDGNAAIFERLLPEQVAAHDPDRFYLASSPTGRWSDPADDALGDSHYWGVWHGELPFATYAERVPRFMSEYGFQSYPALSSIERFTDPGDRQVGSHILSVHQKHPRGDAIIGRFIRDLYGEPRNFAAFCYLSQLAQADGLRVAFEAHRRAMPRCMGSLYWQFNDCWPAISWSSIDYFGQWKALHYQAARSFAPLMLSAAIAEDGAAIHLVSDLLEDVRGGLIVELIDVAGICHGRETVPVAVDGNSAKIVHHVPASALDQARSQGAWVLHARLVDDGVTLARDIRMTEEASRCRIPDPELTTRVVDGRLIVRAERYARAVHLAIERDPADGAAANFTENFFDLLPGEERVVGLRDGVLDPAAVVRATSLWDACDRDEVAAVPMQSSAQG